MQFVGSATIGFDHVDVDYLRSAGIAFAYAPGSNADSVAEYVTAAILRLSIRKAAPLRTKKVAIIGAGEIGGRLAERLGLLGLDVLLNDPPLERALYKGGRSGDFRTLEEVLTEADIVTLHVPLAYEGEHPTFHLIDDSRLAQLKSDSWLLNTSRGAVVDNSALLHRLREDRGPAAVVLDVWEHEPEPDAELVRRVDLATPHIAGYALDAKIRGARLLYDALRRHLGHEKDSFDVPSKENVGPMKDRAPYEASPFVAGPESSVVLRGAPDATLPEIEWLDMLARRMYDIETDSAAMRTTIRRSGIDAASFSSLRRNYPTRREFSAYHIPTAMIPPERRLVVEEAFRVRLI